MVNARVLEKRKERVRRLGSMVVILAAFIVLAWLLAAGGRSMGRMLFTENLQYTLRELVIENPTGRLQDGHIREYAKVKEGMNLFQIDLRRVESDLESVPLIQSVTLIRELPDTLIIRIQERIPVARLGREDARYHLAVDREGYILGPSSRSPYLPAITGVRKAGLRPGSHLADPFFKDALDVLDVCDATHLSRQIKIRAIDVGDPDYLAVLLTNGAKVRLSRNAVEIKLQALAGILMKPAPPGKRLARVDLTVDKNFPVEYR